MCYQYFNWSVWPIWSDLQTSSITVCRSHKSREEGGVSRPIRTVKSRTAAAHRHRSAITHHTSSQERRRNFCRPDLSVDSSVDFALYFLILKMTTYWVPVHFFKKVFDHGWRLLWLSGGWNVCLCVRVCVCLQTSLIGFLSVAFSFNSVSVFGFVPHSHATGAKTALAWT